MQEVWTIMLAFGIPSALVGLALWYVKREITKSQKLQEEHDKNLESLVMMMLHSTHANTMLCKAMAEAVRDGQCNEKMTEAMKIVEKTAEAEEEFLLDKSIKYIFE